MGSVTIGEASDWKGPFDAKHPVRRMQPALKIWLIRLGVKIQQLHLIAECLKPVCEAGRYE